MTAEIFFHIGFPKTASTTLQKSIFENYPGLIRSYDIGGIIIKREELVFESEFDNIKKNIVEPMQKQSEKLVISDEAFATGDQVQSLVGRMTIAQRIERLFPSAKIIVVIRQQLDIIRSLYCQRAKNVDGDFSSLTRFVPWLESNWKNRKYYSDFHNYLYYDLIAYYQRLFGGGNILVLFFEELKNDSNSFYEKISNFMRLDLNQVIRLTQNKHENKRLTEKRYNFQKLKNNFPIISKISASTPRFIRDIVSKKIDDGSEIKVDYPPEWKKKLHNFYAKDNERLCELTGDQPKTYNYPL